MMHFGPVTLKGKPIMFEPSLPKQKDDSSEASSLALDVNLANITSPALARIVEEVRNEEGSTSRNYDRVHNRHNR